MRFHNWIACDRNMAEYSEFKKTRVIHESKNNEKQILRLSRNTRCLNKMRVTKVQIRVKELVSKQIRVKNPLQKKYER